MRQLILGTEQQSDKAVIFRRGETDTVIPILAQVLSGDTFLLQGKEVDSKQSDGVTKLSRQKARILDCWSVWNLSGRVLEKREIDEHTGLQSSLQSNWPWFHRHGLSCAGSGWDSARPNTVPAVGLRAEWWYHGCAVLGNMDFWPAQNKETSLSTSGIKLRSLKIKVLGIWS